MKIPETVKVGPYVYRVLVVDDLRAEEDRREKLFGEVNHVVKEIRLCGGNTPEQLTATFLHECLHVLDDMFLRLNLSEKQVKRLGAGLAMLLGDNHLLRED